MTREDALGLLSEMRRQTDSPPDIDPWRLATAYVGLHGRRDGFERDDERDHLEGEGERRPRRSD